MRHSLSWKLSRLKIPPFLHCPSLSRFKLLLPHPWTLFLLPAFLPSFFPLPPLCSYFSLPFLLIYIYSFQLLLSLLIFSTLLHSIFSVHVRSALDYCEHAVPCTGGGDEHLFPYSEFKVEFQGISLLRSRHLIDCQLIFGMIGWFSGTKMIRQCHGQK